MTRHWMWRLTAVLAMLAGLCSVRQGAAQAQGGQGPPPPNPIWRDVDETTLRVTGKRIIIPDRYRLLVATPSALRARLDSAPREGQGTAQGAETVMSLPLPDGTFGRFRVVEAPVMAPALANLFPQIRTYGAQGLDDHTATARLDWTPAGFHAMIISSGGTVYIDPYSRGDTVHYISYHKQDFHRASLPEPFELGPVDSDPERTDSLAGISATAAISSGTQLRTYRLAMASTGEYTQFHGGTVVDGMAAIVTAVNRVTGIYEREIAVRLELVPNNHLIVYTNGATDPYTNNNGLVMLGENQANLDAVIGNSNYDVGHVFSTGGGGIATLRVPCVTGWKARGVTGLSSPVGDPFYVDYVAHEMGHQFGANHTFNGTAGACSGQRSSTTAYEPGSASTIMGYAGICGSQDLQPHSDDYFHAVSFQEIRNYVTSGTGSACGTITPTLNSPPTVDAGSGGFYIPIETPFTLQGSAIDPDGDPLTYCWEEYDLGPAGHPDSPLGTAPIFRSFPPVTSPSRTFPQISDIVNNTHTIGEILPGITRQLTFRLTARDNRGGGGGVAYDAIQFSSTAAAGPFLVTQPNTGVVWSGGTRPEVQWDVASTDLSPVNCSGVDVLLSTDGGYTYPITLITDTPNDGAEPVPLPQISSATARVKVACADNVFFDISDADFTIVPFPATITKTVTSTGTIILGDLLTYTLVISAPLGSELGLYDPLTNTTFVRFVTPPPSGILSQTHAVTGSLTVTPTNQITLAFTAQFDVTDHLGTYMSVLNRACIYHIPWQNMGGCFMSNSVTNGVDWPYWIWLPVAARDG